MSERLEHKTRKVIMPSDFGTWNCLAGCIATAANTLLTPKGYSMLSEQDVMENLPVPYDLRYFCLSKTPEVISTLNKIKNLPLYWYQTYIKYRKDVFIHEITERLRNGELVVLFLEGDKWAEKVYGGKAPRGSSHAVLVTGINFSSEIVSLQVYDRIARGAKAVSFEMAFQSVYGSSFFYRFFLDMERPIGILGAHNFQK